MAAIAVVSIISALVTVAYATDQSGTPAVTVCGLLANPKNYVGHRVRLQATLAANEEFWAFTYDSCQPKPEEVGGKHPLIQPSFANVPRVLNSSFGKKLNKILRRKHQARVTIVGVFDDPGTFFGHQLCCRYRFDVSDVVAVEQVREKSQNIIPTWRNGSREKMCGVGTYHDALDLAFKNANLGPGDILVTVQVLPSFQNEYALVLKRVDSEIALMRVTFQHQLWTRLGPPLATPNTRQRCLELAMSAKSEAIKLPVSAEETEQMWKTFINTSLDTDSCPRRHKTCANFKDGTDFVIETRGVPPLVLFDIAGIKGIKSENSALLDWVYALVQTAKNARPN
jgi:hypothetical protein